MNWKLVSYLLTTVLIKLILSLFIYYFPFPIFCQHSCHFKQQDATDYKIVGEYTCQKISVFYQASRNKIHHSCGGALITSQWVVSAAHCYGSQIQVRLEGKDGSEWYINATKIIRHPSYNSKPIDNDIMLIKLSTPATLNSRVQPVSLPTSCVTAGTQCLIYSGSLINGANYHDTLECLKAPVVSSTECKNTYSGSITSNMICLKFLGDGRSPGRGDSGYPVVCNGKLQGLLSWGTFHSNKDHLEVYTKVCNYIPWINSTIESN
ncbi:trypsin-like [Anolis sagrei]|uniref:trypsin-like n=1 Tax=Anolis sagrei TaxID=38937 RepID=UPI003522AD51